MSQRMRSVIISDDGADSGPVWRCINYMVTAPNADCSGAGSEVTDICEESSRSVRSGHVVTPRYPDVSPPNTNCKCRLQVDRPAARLRLDLFDLTLETRNGRCQADWVMLRQKGTDFAVRIDGRFWTISISGFRHLENIEYLIPTETHYDYALFKFALHITIMKRC